MIIVEDLSKTFPGSARPALDHVSFTARPGEVLGFLGQNGAGKTTTMRVLAGYLRSSGGRASICGHDVASDSLAARQHLGYLPEQVPLYPELRVCEYLGHRAELKGVPRRRRAAAIAQVVEQVGLRGQERRLIGQLSKGFRQRVGLADALLHQPPALILDEPTDGLDPNQRREVLQLIAALARERAVILSTHVLPEVEVVCQRVVILERGRVAATGTPAEIARRLVRPGQIELTCRGEREPILAALRAVPRVHLISEVAPRAGPEAGALHLRIQLADAEGDAELQQVRACEALARAVLSIGELQQMTPARSDLEAVFRTLTGEQAAPATPSAAP